MPETIVGCFFENAKKFADKPALTSKIDGKYQDMSYSDAAEAITNFAYGLKKLGVEKGDRIAILSENRPAWAITDMAILSLGAITIPIYPTISISQVEFMLNDSESKFIIVSNQDHLHTISSIFNNLKSLRRIITIFEHDEDDTHLQINFSEVAADGKVLREKEPTFLEEFRTELKGSEMISVLYTSGTTGNPKGVMLSSSNFLSNIRAGLKFVPVNHDDKFLSFLPLCHVFERCLGYYLPLYLGGTIIYAESIETVGDNMREVKPTIMISVPRLYEKIYSLVMDSVAKGSPVKKLIFKWCVRIGKKHFVQKKKGKVSGLLSFQYGIAEKLVFQKLRDRTGGSMRYFASGGAPLSAEIGEFFAAAGLTILEGYGLTETSPIITVNPAEDFRFGTVGPVIEGVEVMIASDGEILTRGPHVMLGYYKNEVATKEVIDPDGWFHTGDIGFLDSDGYLTITDRKKNLIVTSGGKNIAPGPIENLMVTSRYIDQILMIGDKRQFPAALVVPSLDNLEDHFQLQDIKFSSKKEMINDQRVIDLVQSEIDRLSVNLSQYEKIKKVMLLEEELTQAKGELTPTMKIKRKVVEKKLAKDIDKLYK